MRVRVWERFTGESGGGSGLPCWDEGEPDVPVGGEEIGIGERKRKTPGGLEPWMRGDVQRPWPELVVVTRFHSVIFVERGTRLFGGWRFLFLFTLAKKGQGEASAGESACSDAKAKPQSYHFRFRPALRFYVHHQSVAPVAVPLDPCPPLRSKCPHTQ